MSENVAFAPLFSFPDESPSFTHGFEAGMIWQRMQAGEANIETGLPVHVANREILQRMARAAGYVVTVIDLMPDDTWMDVTLEKLTFGPTVIEGGKS